MGIAMSRIGMVATGGGGGGGDDAAYIIPPHATGAVLVERGTSKAKEKQKTRGYL